MRSASLLERVDRASSHRLDRQFEYVRAVDRRPGRGAQCTISADTGSARISSIRRAICLCSNSFRRQRPTRLWSPLFASSPIAGSARTSSSRRTRRDSSRTTSPCTASCAFSRRSPPGQYTVEEIDAITGPAIGTAEERDVSHRRHRGARHPRARRSRSRGAAAPRSRRAVSVSAVRQRDGEARVDWREGRPRLLRAAEGRRR